MHERWAELYVPPVWRSSLLDPVQQRRLHFAAPSALLAHLAVLVQRTTPTGTPPFPA